MKTPFAFLLLFMSLLFFSCDANTVADIGDDSTEEASEILQLDTLLANELGADDYGMKSYVMAFLKAGPNRDLPQEEANQLQRAHLDNITRMAEEGKLVLAGPFLDNGELRGIYVFNVATVEEAQLLTESDPAVQAGSLIMELKPWYGSAAIMKVNEIHERIARVNI